MFNGNKEDVPGLEVLNANGIWVPAPPIDHAFVVNTGAYFELLSNSQFLSTVHRVHTKVNSLYNFMSGFPSILIRFYLFQLSVERFSLATFISPDPSVYISTHPALLKEGEESKFASHHIGKRYITGLVHNSPNHPWCKRLKASGIKEEDYKWELLMQAFPDD
jgi:2OG-Fe(II) oxygenase superfamily